MTKGRYGKYKMWYYFCDTEKEAQECVEEENATFTPYMKKHKPASYTPWSSQDGKEKKYIVWTWVF